LNRWHSGAVFVLAMMLGCASTAPVVDVDPNRGLAPVEVETYSLVVERMPGFLVPFMRDELVAALAARGVEEVGSGGDVEFRLVFEQVTLLEGDVPARDKFEGTIAPEEASRFLARVELIALMPGKSVPIRVGAISRVHTVTAGVYMHARAHAAIRRGFDELLDGFVAAGAATSP
jgi:hypothetical protein